MAITTQSINKIQLYQVTLHWDWREDSKVIMSLKELQSKIQRWNNITKIEKIVITIGEEVSVEDIKPKNKKGKPYTYQEIHGQK